MATLNDSLSELPLDPETEVKMRAIFASLIHDLLDAIDVFGYEAVYFGVGCEVFPDAADPRLDPAPRADQAPRDCL